MNTLKLYRNIKSNLLFNSSKKSFFNLLNKNQLALLNLSQSNKNNFQMNSQTQRKFTNKILSDDDKHTIVHNHSHPNLSSLSPLDGRYHKQTDPLRVYFSEAALIKYRTLTEIEWIKFLLTQVFSEKDLAVKFAIHTEAEKKATLEKLDDIINFFDFNSAKSIKDIEAITNHDVKAVEYYIKNQFKLLNINEKLLELVHFCCTSEDINNISTALMLKDGLNLEYLPKLNHVVHTLVSMSEHYADIPLMSKTHGQPATPSTMGKEIANFAFRINEQSYFLKNKRIKAKINGAVGNFNAHLVVLPHVNWTLKSQNFIEKLGLEWNPYTTQIENHDSFADIFNSVSLINTIMLGMSRDFWGYISLNYFKQKLKKDEVGSSTMPHKVNPIDFENAEGNLGLSNALLKHLSEKLPISRFQRDLSDSTVLRNVGTAFGYSTLAYDSLLKGLKKLEVNVEVIEHDLDLHWELLAEPLQTVMRFYGYHNPYELLKDLTRGKKFTKEAYLKFVHELNLPEEVKKQLLELTPRSYLGNSREMALNIKHYLK